MAVLGLAVGLQRLAAAQGGAAQGGCRAQPARRPPIRHGICSASAPALNIPTSIVASWQMEACAQCMHVKEAHTAGEYHTYPEVQKCRHSSSCRSGRWGLSLHACVRAQWTRPTLHECVRAQGTRRRWARPWRRRRRPGWMCRWCGGRGWRCGSCGARPRASPRRRPAAEGTPPGGPHDARPHQTRDHSGGRAAPLPGGGPANGAAPWAARASCTSRRSRHPGFFSRGSRRHRGSAGREGRSPPPRDRPTAAGGDMRGGGGGAKLLHLPEEQQADSSGGCSSGSSGPASSAPSSVSLSLASSLSGGSSAALAAAVAAGGLTTLGGMHPGPQASGPSGSSAHGNHGQPQRNGHHQQQQQQHPERERRSRKEKEAGGKPPHLVCAEAPPEHACTHSPGVKHDHDMWEVKHDHDMREVEHDHDMREVKHDHDMQWQACKPSCESLKLL